MCLWKSSLIAICLTITANSYADELTIKMNLLDENGVGKEIGKITASDSKYGLLLTPALSDLTFGFHGLHVHEKPDCASGEKEGKKVAGLAAGGHYDPQNTGKHLGPYGEGHLGDLPPLIVGKDNSANLSLLAPRLKVADLKGHSLMIHVGGDNFADEPEKLGGGGARMACGVIAQTN